LSGAKLTCAVQLLASTGAMLNRSNADLEATPREQAGEVRDAGGGQHLWAALLIHLLRRVCKAPTPRDLRRRQLPALGNNSSREFWPHCMLHAMLGAADVVPQLKHLGVAASSTPPLAAKAMLRHWCTGLVGKPHPVAFRTQRCQSHNPQRLPCFTSSIMWR